MSRTELWEAPKGSGTTGHIGFTVDDDEMVRLPYAILTILLRDHAGLRRKLNTDHGLRFSLHPEQTAPATGEKPPPPGYRWITPRECHNGDTYCEACAPNAPERRVAPDPSQTP